MYELRFKAQIGRIVWWTGFNGSLKMTKRRAYRRAEHFLRHRGDEWPVLQITNTKTGEVFYLTRHDPS